MSKIIKTYYTNGNINSEGHRLNGKFHREDGPAIIYYYENGNIRYIEYRLDGEMHKEDGPAYIQYDEAGYISYSTYYLNGIKLEKNDWFKQLSAEAKLKIAFGVQND
jgi:antitoxin component YwqK of YwqJK toxin-antitoxin module